MGYWSNGINYQSICSPNHLHDAHIRLALRIGADAICEKPLVLNPWNLDALEKLEMETHKIVYPILQLRLHLLIIALRNKLKSNNGKKHEVVLTYVTSRGLWYRYSWKGDKDKSGGTAMNIGIHFFDLVIWLFGCINESIVHIARDDKMGGFLSLQNANVKWFLSLDKNDLPEECLINNKTIYRSISIDGEELEFTEDFADLHTKVYKNILEGNGLGINEVRPSIEAVYNIRTAKVSKVITNVHPFIKKNIVQYIV